ncbi:MAG: diguanylate cyclase [Acidobacteria bacterium]|nr:diguanylate cyclase [Acidobacteriota bacterium]MBV9478753.1 diguanylate cyclase [Acidobacteriota bacterium]
MTKPLRLLLIEDSDLDAAHLTLELRRGGFDPNVTRVETRDDFETALLDGTAWDAIISDYHLPRFSAPEALDVYRMHRLDLPFLVVSGAIGEETAVELMKGGAHDYLLKHRLTRLAVAVERELQQAQDRRAKRHAENLFQNVLRASPLPSVLVDRTTRQIVDGSDAFRRQFVTGSDYATDRNLFSLIEFSQPERIDQLVARGAGTAWYSVHYVDGAARMANVRCYTVEHEETSYAYLILEDVTEQHYLKAAFDAVPDAVLILSAQQKLLYANRAAEELFGELYFGADVTPLLGDWWRGSERFEARRVELKQRPYDASGVPFRFAGEAETSTILTLHDVADEEELRRLATHDALTGIVNRRRFDELLAECIGDGGTLALLDLDYFKPINDELGHAAGDAALRTFVRLVQKELRPADIFARLGGDEFGVFFPRASLAEAEQVIASVYDRLATTPFRYSGATRMLGASCGIACAREGDTPATLQQRADAALYEAKRAGRGRWAVEKMNEERRTQNAE